MLNVGGLVGHRWSDYYTFSTSYWDKQTSGRTSRQTASAGGKGKTTVELQEPTAATGIYSSWSTDVWDFGTTKQYPALKYRDGTVMPNQGREPPEDVPQMPQVEIVGVPAGAVDEGASITLTASSASSASVIPLDYRWSQVSGGGLLVEPTSRSSVTIEVPEDYVPANANTVNLAIMLDVISDVGSTTQHVSITIAKRNNGQIESLSIPSLNERVLTAPSIDLSGDPDGGVGNIVYQWQSRESDQTTRTVLIRESDQTTTTVWKNISAGMSEAYTIAEDVTGIFQYRVIVSYTDGQGYSEEVISLAVVSVVNPTSCDPTDIDQDDDGLIEICDLEGLNAMRHQLDGTGYKASELSDGEDYRRLPCCWLQRL